MNITKKFGKKAIAFVLAVAMLVGVLMVNHATTIRFVDVPDGQWYTEPINRLAEAGVVSGVGQNKFEPGREVANAEMVKMLVNAFFRNEFNAYEAANSNAMYAHFGSQLYWFSFMCYYAEQVGLLDGVNVDIDDYASCYTYMSRYDMAMVLYNAAAKKGVTVSADAKAVAKAELMGIGHYYDIPEQYRDVVVTVYASKLINGKGEQGFCGTDNMTRAEACTVLIRLEDLLKNGGGSTVDPDPGPSEPTVPTVKDIVVTTKANATLTNVQGGPFHGTAHNIADNGNPTGYLANGKPINEANIAELLTKAKTIWPADMAWSEATTNNNWYDNPGTIAKNMTLTNGIFTSPNAGCSGFASMISDYLFGKESNPYHTVTNFADIRPGDIIFMLNADKSVHHAMIVTSINQTGSRAGYVFCAEGNSGDVVQWANTASAWNAWGPTELSAHGSYVILSRWPA